MSQIHRVIGQGWVGLTFCGLLAVGTFAIGYWQGQRNQAAKDAAEPRPIAQLTQPPIWGHPLPSIYGAKPPQENTPEMAEYRNDQVKLAQSYAQLRGANGASPSPQAYAQFQQQNAALLKRQQQLAQILSQQRAKNPLAEPPPLQIPSNATPQQRTYLTERDKLVRDQIALINQHKNDDPATRQAAMAQWRQQNVDRFHQLQQMAQAAAQSTSASSASSLAPAINPSSGNP